jgi:hypothetical protein
MILGLLGMDLVPGFKVIWYLGHRYWYRLDGLLFSLVPSGLEGLT